MPIGDPGGGNFTYTVEGLPESIFAAVIPVSDLDRGESFYTGLLGMKILYRTDTEIGMGRNNARLILRISGSTGVDTGVIFGVVDPYDLHRRLVDEGVIFVEDPVRKPFGVCTSFKDDDGNILHAMEMNAPIRRLR